MSKALEPGECPVGFLISEDGRVGPLAVDLDKVSVLSRTIGCDVIDMVHRPIGGETYVIVCDDEGLIRERPPTAFDNSQHVALFGDILVLRDADEPGEVRGLTAAEIRHVRSNLAMLIGNTGRPEIPRTILEMGE
ncbi:hypothetical protein PAA26_04520 [Methanomassiliicoccaceae archaeon COG_1]|nr:hypothetical protein [Methanomassiliicoccaceae archaeon COG_1]